MTMGDVFYSERLWKASEETTLGQRPREGRKRTGSSPGGEVQADGPIYAEAREEHPPGVFPAAASALTGWADWRGGRW